MMYINGNSMRCYQCEYYRAEPNPERGQWWDGWCANKYHCKRFKAKCPAKVEGWQMACFDAELPEQIEMEATR